MVLVDTSVWINHLRRTSPPLAELLTEEEVLIHPFIIGELACGTLKDRQALLIALGELPAAVSARYEEVMQMIQTRGIWGQGIGWTDAHLLASALLTGARLWTLDGRLEAVAEKIGVALFTRPAEAATGF